MNWEAIGAVGELVGAVGVMVTLLYVGLQVRQNTSAVKAAAIQDISSSTTAYLNAWSTDDRLPGLFARIWAGELPEAFSTEERARLAIAYTSMLRVFEARYLQIRLGVLDEDILESMAGAASLFQTAWFKATWSGFFEPSVGREFAQFVREKFEIE